MKIYSFAIVLFQIIIPLLLISQNAPKPFISEASGVFKVGNLLYIVSDNTTGKYMTYDITGLQLSISKELNDQKKILEHDLKLGPIMLDLEGIVVVDKKVLVVSEKTRSILSKEEVVKTFSERFSEYANRGIEGIAQRTLFPDCSIYEIASIWEGGYPAKDDLPIGLKSIESKESMNPIIVTNTYDSKLKLGQSRIVKLNMNTINNWADENINDCDEPFANRYRAPDLVFHQEGFIVLLSSERSIPKGSKDKLKYKSKLLQRFDINGQPIKEPLNLNTTLKDLVKLNWEGLTWNEYGKSLLLINDDDKNNPVIVSIELPKEWQ